MVGERPSAHQSGAVGLKGPVTINGDQFNREGGMNMPGMYNALDDREKSPRCSRTFANEVWMRVPDRAGRCLRHSRGRRKD